MNGEPAGDQVLTVGEFTRRLKALVEGAVPPGWVRGEVSNLRIQSSGHVYFSLKDSAAQLSAVLFRGDAARQKVKLCDGMQVVAFGRLEIYEPHGKYQLTVRVLVEDGVGRLQREFEALKRRLDAEGLFAPERKRPIPPLPSTVGFVTSPTGAAVRDFLRILTRRGWRGRVVILPARVQGDGAAADMIEMIQLAVRLGGFDLLVIGRGGGSAEDLWAFNDEALVRAIAACPVPVISAVGHEIDFTLCDFASDLRAETPSAAAELISSHFVSCVERAGQAADALSASVARAVERSRKALAHARDRLRLLTPSAQIERGYLRLDDCSNRLGSALRGAVQGRRHRFSELRARFTQVSPAARLELASQRLDGLGKRLRASSPASVLNRGFAIVRDDRNQPLTRRAAVRSGQKVSAEFADGAAPMRAE